MRLKPSLISHFKRAALWAVGALTAAGAFAYYQSSQHVSNETYATMTEAFTSMADPVTIGLAVAGSIAIGSGMAFLGRYVHNVAKPD